MTDEVKVKPKIGAGFKERYGKGATHKPDAIGDALAEALPRGNTEENESKLLQILKDNGLTNDKLAGMKNYGMRRMCVGNIVRALCGKGTDVKILGKTVKGGSVPKAVPPPRKAA